MHSPIQSYLDRLHAQFAGLREGAVATYIPELAKADPDWFGISLATVDGKVYETGDSRQEFTIQSISKPFVYGLALEDNGRDRVLRKIGVEPSGDAFNSISLSPTTGAPLNPMINAGAIAATSLVAGHSLEDKLFRLISVLSLYAGRELSVDRAVFESERETGHRNRAIGHMLRNFDIITEPPDPSLDLYFQQCSVAVTCRDLSMMAATLANGGIHPVSGERAVRGDYVGNILSVMTTCGMYDYAGEWVYWIGMPAKSGVAGGILAVLPGQLGIGVFSPRLDARGNSVRGVEVCKTLSSDFGLHCLRTIRIQPGTIRSAYDIASVGSKRLRNEREREILDRLGHQVMVLELQGTIGFAGVEAIVRHLADVRTPLEYAVLDLRRVAQVDDLIVDLLIDLVRELAANQRRLVLASADKHLLRLLEERLGAEADQSSVQSFPDLDRAIEWCETQLITKEMSAKSTAVELAQNQVCRGMTTAEIARLGEWLEKLEFARGEVIVRKGEAADKMYLLRRGEVSVTVDLPNGQLKRLSTFVPGMTFGELAFIGGARRTADVRADLPTECYGLTTAAFEKLTEQDPRMIGVLLNNLLANAARIIGRLNQEVAALAS